MRVTLSAPEHALLSCIMMYDNTIRVSKMTKDMNGILTVRQVALKLTLSNTTIYRYIHAGSLKAYKIGGLSAKRHWRIKTEDLDEFITKDIRNG